MFSMSTTPVTRDAFLGLRLAQRERAVLDELAEGFGLSVSDLARRALALGAERLRARAAIPLRGVSSTLIAAPGAAPKETPECPR